MLGIGDPVPALPLPAYLRGELSAIDVGGQRGQWTVVLFAPRGPAASRLADLRDASLLQPEFERLGVQVMGVTPEPMAEHMAWAGRTEVVRKLRIPVLSDASGRLARAFGVYREITGASLRGSFVVDPQGRVRALAIHGEEVPLDVADTLRQVRASITADASARRSRGAASRLRPAAGGAAFETVGVV
jgi:peroxiredoxin (alkyl hydroperoxide reductase subunit C)